MMKIFIFAVLALSSFAAIEARKCLTCGSIAGAIDKKCEGTVSAADAASQTSMECEKGSDKCFVTFSGTITDVWARGCCVVDGKDTCKAWEGQSLIKFKTCNNADNCNTMDPRSGNGASTLSVQGFVVCALLLTTLSQIIN